MNLLRCIGSVVVVVLAAAASASADPTVTLDRTCYSPGDAITRTGTGFTPAAQATESVSFQTETLPVISLGSIAGATLTIDAQGGFKDVVRAPKLRRPDKDYSEIAIDTFTDAANPTKPATARWTLADWTVYVGAWAERAARPGEAMTVYAFGWTTRGTVLYMHYYRGTKRYKTVRVGRLQGPCGDLSKRLKQFPFAHPKPGAWRVFFSTTKELDKVEDAWIRVAVRVPR
jgi:hypothetical protein